MTTSDHDNRNPNRENLDGGPLVCVGLCRFLVVVTQSAHTFFLAADTQLNPQMPVSSPSQIAITVVGSSPRVRAAQQETPRRPSFSDVVRGSNGVHLVKRFLYGWTVVVILMGVGLLGLGLYLLYFQENVHIAPAFVYYVASYTGLALSLLSGLGLYGLQQQRQCVTAGKRNYALGLVRYRTL